MHQTKDEVIGEVHEIFADAVAGRDLDNIEKRLSVAATKLDALVEERCHGLSRFVVNALDAFRKSIAGNPKKAQYYARALQNLVDDDTKAAEENLDDFSVREFLSNLS